jgi:hypothetical protein
VIEVNRAALRRPIFVRKQLMQGARMKGGTEIGRLLRDVIFLLINAEAREGRWP